MAFCFLNNIYCLYFPAHCSHGMQPADNGPFNVLKASYRKHLSLLNSLTDSAPVDKVNFLRCYSKAREEALTKRTILGGFRVTGVWPISRITALDHPEIQDPDSRKRTRSPDSDETTTSIKRSTPINSRQILDLAIGSTPARRLLFRKVAKAFDHKAIELVEAKRTIRRLEQEVERLQRKKTRKKIPNPNQRFITIGEALASGATIPEDGRDQGPLVIDSTSEEDSDLDFIRSIEDDPPEPYLTRSGRVVKPRVR